jgi:glycosyltransferase involved in cell wall biosynthesis
MQILLITEYLPATDRAEITGGVEAYAHYVSGHLRRDHEVEVLCRPTKGEVWDDASLRSIPGRLLFLLRALWRGLRAPADVIVATTYVVHPIAWLVAKLRRKPVVWWYPDVLIGEWRNGQFGKVAGLVGEVTERVLVKLPVDRYIAISQSTADKLIAHGVRPERVTVVPCGMERSVIDSVVPERPEGERITVVGRLVPYKRVDLVIRALARLRASHPTLELVVIGQGPEMAALQDLVPELGVEAHVDLRGFVASHTDVLAAMAGSSAFVSASEIEGFGIVLVESMALGVPYVASDIPAFREVTAGGVGGRLFRVGDEEDLVRQLDELLRDPDRERLVAAGRAHAARYDWAAVADDTAEVLQAVVDSGKRPPGRLR